MDPIRVLVKRGGLVEAEHLVHAAAVRDGKTVASAGNPRLVTFMRSSSKPVQALPFARAYDIPGTAEPYIAPPAPAAPPRLELAAEPISAGAIGVGPRVGLRLAGEVPWRFWIASDPTVSTYRAAVVRPKRG